jgi:hypothetical protein
MENCGPSRLHLEREKKKMKRTLTVLTAAMFAAAIAVPAFAQAPAAAESPAAEASTAAPAEGGAAMSEAPAKPKKHRKHHKKAAAEGGMASPEASPAPANP